MNCTSEEEVHPEPGKHLQSEYDLEGIRIWIETKTTQLRGFSGC